MTPLDFLDFRDLLFPASGFQSVQFRTIEIRLGLASRERLRIDGKPFEARLSEADRARITAAMQGPKLVDQLDDWLARTPFVAMGGYAFSNAYRAAVKLMLEADAARIRASTVMSPEQRAIEARAIEQALAGFEALFAPPSSEASPWRMSLAAVQAALFIMVYRDRPVLQIGYRLLAALMDVEETLTLWRYRHALMVQRMIGVKIGTGSSGHDYLRATAEQHRVFADLFQLSTYLIPRSALPPLPPEVEKRMGFVYAAES
jgi:tryptophan 2,3-dioxygenase